MERELDALALYQMRKNEIRMGAKLSENMRRASIRFWPAREDIRRYSEKHHRDRGHIESRPRESFKTLATLADQIKPEAIDGWIARNTKAAATANRNRSGISVLRRR